MATPATKNKSKGMGKERMVRGFLLATYFGLIAARGRRSMGRGGFLPEERELDLERMDVGSVTPDGSASLEMEEGSWASTFIGGRRGAVPPVLGYSPLMVLLCRCCLHALVALKSEGRGGRQDGAAFSRMAGA